MARSVVSVWCFAPENGMMFCTQTKVLFTISIDSGQLFRINQSKSVFIEDEEDGNKVQQLNKESTTEPEELPEELYSILEA
ncbi:hypothetical protein RND71_021046 [Anisodus tanguticus]|uniref:Uncharacterized protein n=1 Tax=Anisodus tanguticus TaxID=243964 RepID=A0AAE1RXD3_9SOLA|nr:hypothetical protein RND71_021046 [Anisodus tanguticus]